MRRDALDRQIEFNKKNMNRHNTSKVKQICAARSLDCQTTIDPFQTHNKRSYI
jgi:hypothetical protein